MAVSPEVEADDLGAAVKDQADMGHLLPAVKDPFALLICFLPDLETGQQVRKIFFPDPGKQDRSQQDVHLFGCQNIFFIHRSSVWKKKNI